MTNAEAYRQMYGSVPNMQAVLQQRRAIAAEGMETAERLLKKLCERFPPVDSAGASLKLTLDHAWWTLKRQIEEMDEIIAECEPEADTHTKDTAKPARSERLRKRRKP